ncbi:MAG TPA: L-lactate dehydrogenase [Spirochaetaceae bacterium]|nr:L-lactate dehydrogenase [Spirochaetaceae bacterium]
MSKLGKIVIIGAGHVGSHCAMSLASGEVGGEIVLIDKDGPKARAQALDVSDALSYSPSAARVRSGAYPDCADADIVVIAIGEPHRLGQTRLDLLERSVMMLRELLGVLKPLNLGGIVITITNPADIVADFVRKGLDLPRSRAFGTGTLLDTARLLRLLSEQTGLERGEIEALSMGEHGDSSMIPFSRVSLGGKSFDAFPNLDRAGLLQATRRRGMDILEGKGCTEFGIGEVLSILCRCVMEDEKLILPLSARLMGEYGQEGIHCGVPCRVGRGGIETVIELPLEPDELAQFNKSCDIIRRHIGMAKEIAQRS